MCIHTFLIFLFMNTYTFSLISYTAKVYIHTHGVAQLLPTHFLRSGGNLYFFIPPPVVAEIDRKKPPPPRVFPIFYVPLSRTVSERTPLEAPGTNASRGVLLLTVVDEGT